MLGVRELEWIRSFSSVSTRDPFAWAQFSSTAYSPPLPSSLYQGTVEDIEILLACQHGLIQMSCSQFPSNCNIWFGCVGRLDCPKIRARGRLMACQFLLNCWQSYPWRRRLPHSVVRQQPWHQLPLLRLLCPWHGLGFLELARRPCCSGGRRQPPRRTQLQDGPWWGQEKGGTKRVAMCC